MRGCFLARKGYVGPSNVFTTVHDRRRFSSSDGHSIFLQGTITLNCLFKEFQLQHHSCMSCFEASRKFRLYMQGNAVGNFHTMSSTWHVRYAVDFRKGSVNCCFLLRRRPRLLSLLLSYCRIMDDMWIMHQALVNQLAAFARCGAHTPRLDIPGGSVFMKNI